MTDVQINLNEEVNKQIELYKAENGFSNKANAVEDILQKYFLNKKMMIKKRNNKRDGSDK